MKDFRLLMALAFMATTPALGSAETVYDLSTDGVSVSASQYACPSGLCTPCVGGSPTHGPVVSFGQTGFNGQNAWGTVNGTFSASARLDGVLVPGNLLPAGSFFRSYLFLRHSFCLGFSGNDNCPGFQCGVSYQVGSQVATLGRSSNVQIPIDVPAHEAVNGTFAFSFCNHHIIWGAGCGIVDSQNFRWRVHTPAPVRAIAVAAGDAAPFSFTGTGISIDKSSGPAGVISGTRVTGAPPVPPPPPTVTPGYPDYWELRTDMPQGGFGVQLQLAYDPAQVSLDTPEQDLRIWRYDMITDQWTMLPTVIDLVAHTATVTGLDRFSIFCLGDQTKVVPAKAASWGTVKTIYR